ncbi:MAG: FAD-dependent oxidoreductase, partial [Verrucomicrobia bacterium]
GLGGCLLNHARVTQLTKKDGLVNGVEFTDQLSGETYRVEARVVINATGIFTDEIRRLDDPQAVSTVQPSQGVHLVFSKDFLASNSAIMVPHTDDGRVLFVIPWHNRVIVGTTDTAMSKPEIEPRALDEEVEFILRNASRYLAKSPTRKDILSVFAGQRPLVRPPGKGDTATKTISRNHEIFVSNSGLLTVAGGKWTTYRKMAEDAVDHALQLSGHGHSPCVTERLHLHGWRSARASQSNELLRVYGTDIFELQILCEENPRWQEPLHPKLPYPKSVIPWAVRREMAFTVEDVLARRTRALFLDTAAAAEVAPEVAEIMRAELGLNEEWARAQIIDFQRLAKCYSLN